MGSRFSNNISKKMCVLEIDLELAKPVPDKADKLNRKSVSKSPENFASGGTKNGHVQRRPVPATVYPYVSVGISVGISLLVGPLTGFRYRDMNSVGDQISPKVLNVSHENPAGRGFAGFFVARSRIRPPSIPPSLNL
ncbi:hypothetical protein [Burkholderia ubonensis]|uniref:hypothetical protein n=1 Tax=Burkholderia ubonensis TaxID=101571 RepID=UPI0012FA48D7|nr:hypothetical protein [Burkholderia ubonensis]